MLTVNKNNVEIIRTNSQKRIKNHRQLTVLCPSEVVKTILKALHFNNRVECVTEKL